jgi:hypothetical protein
MTTRQRFLAGMIGGALAAAIVLGVTIKDLGLVHGTTTPGAIYCTELDERYGATVSPNAECVDMFDALDEDTQRQLLEDLGDG